MAIPIGVFMAFEGLGPISASNGKRKVADTKKAGSLARHLPISPPENCENSPLYNPESATHSPAPMNFAAIDWLSISINLLLVVFVIVCLLMTLLILMQRPKQEGLGAAFGAGVTDQVFGARTTNVLQRGTVYLGSLFFILALALAVLIGHKNKKTSMLEPAAPAAKVEETKPAQGDDANKPKSLIEELPADDKTPAETPAPVVPAPADLPPAGEPAPPADAPKPADAAPADTTPPTDTTPPADASKPADSTPPADASGTPGEKSGQP
jgi:preprotein translocase subunit SecG